MINDTKTNPLGTQSSQAGSPGNAGSKPNDFEPISVGDLGQVQTPKVDPVMAAKAFELRVENNSEAASGILDIVSGVPHKLLSWKAGSFIEKQSDINDMLLPLKPSTKSQNAASQALARIFARRSESSEALDITILVAYLAELGTGTALVFQRLNKLEEKLLAERPAKGEKE